MSTTNQIHPHQSILYHSYYKLCTCLVFANCSFFDRLSSPAVSNLSPEDVKTSSSGGGGKTKGSSRWVGLYNYLMDYIFLLSFSWDKKVYFLDIVANGNLLGVGGVIFVMGKGMK